MSSSAGESDTVELGGAPDKTLPSEVCAFVNASGGSVFIGVDDNGSSKVKGKSTIQNRTHGFADHGAFQ